MLVMVMKARRLRTLTVADDLKQHGLMVEAYAAVGCDFEVMDGWLQGGFDKLRCLPPGWSLMSPVRLSERHLRA